MTEGASLIDERGPQVCDVCGRPDCLQGDDHLNRAEYPFIPGGRDPMSDKAWVTAPHRIVDHELQRVVYGTGDRVPIEDAVKYGLVDAPDEPVEPGDVEEPKPTQAKRGRRTRAKTGPTEDR